MYSISVEGRFSSSHFLEDYDGNCARIHGHNWKVQVEIRGNHLANDGMLMDFTVLKKELDSVTAEFDHTIINDHTYFKENHINPTAETLARYFYLRLEACVHPNRIHRISIFETDDTIASYLPHEC